MGQKGRATGPRRRGKPRAAGGNGRRRGPARAAWRRLWPATLVGAGVTVALVVAAVVWPVPGHRGTAPPTGREVARATAPSPPPSTVARFRLPTPPVPPRTVAALPPAAAPAAEPAPTPVPGPALRPPEPAPELRAAVPPAAAAPGPSPPARAGEGRGPALAIVIDDLGPDRAALDRVLALPAPLTLAFLPYAEGLPGASRRARAAGHEVFLHLGMAPEGAADPGPGALLAGLDADEVRRRTRRAIDRVEGAVGVNNHMGSRLTADGAAMDAVMAEIGRRGLAFVDSRTTPRTVAEATARRLGVPTAGRDVFLDNVPEVAAVLAELARAEAVARRTGAALAIGHPYPATVEALRAWLPAARARGLRLATAREVIALRAAPRGSPAG